MEDLTILTRGKKRSIKGFEKTLIELGLLKLRGFKKSDVNGIELNKFIHDFLTKYNSRSTLNVKGGAVQTEGGRRRSGGDVFRLCKYYYPECTLNEVLYTLNNMTDMVYPLHKNIVSSICGQINKRVYRANIWGGAGIRHNAGIRDEFNLTTDKYKNLIINK